MWNALRKKVNKSSRSYQLSASHSHQSDSEDSDGGSGGGVSTKVVHKRYTRIPSYSETLSDTAGADSAGVVVTPRYENPYASLDSRAALTTTPGSDSVKAAAAAGSWSTLDNARHLLPSNGDAAHDLRNNNHPDDDVMKCDNDVIAADGNPDGNANHFGTATAADCRVSPPRLKRREKSTATDAARKHTTVVTLQPCDVTLTSDTSSQQGGGLDSGDVAIPGPLSTGVAADDEESGYSTLRDILGQVERAMLEQQQQQQPMLSVTEDHADSDMDTSGDCRDIDLEQAGHSRSADTYWTPPPTQVHDQPPLPLPRCQDQLSDRSDTRDQNQHQFNHEETQRSGLSAVNRNRREMSTDTSNFSESGGEAVITASDQITTNYDVPRSTPIRHLDDGKCHGVRRPRVPPPPPPIDNNADDASSTPLEGTPRSQTSSVTLTQQQIAVELESTSTADDQLLRVELNGEMLTVSEPTHMSWEEVLQSAQELGIPLQPQRPLPAIMTRSDSAAVRRSSTSSSVTSSDRSFVSSPVNGVAARCRTSAPPVVLPRHIVSRRAISSSPSTKQPKPPMKTIKGASPFREKLHNLFARKSDEHHQSKDRGRSTTSPTNSRRSCSVRLQQRDGRDDADCLERPVAAGTRPYPRRAVDMSAKAAELVNCGYRESMLSVLSSSFSSGSLGSIFSHASSSVSSNSSAAARHHRHQYHHQQSSSSSSSSSAWRNSIAG